MGVSNSHQDRKRIGIIGLGSIGVKHSLELKKLGVSEIIAFRTNKGAMTIPEELQDIVRFETNLDDFLKNDFDGILIANPTSMHIDSLKSVADLGVPIFIEKPLTDDSKKIEDIKNIDTSNIQIGFCLRYHSLFQKIKDIIDEGVLGDIYMANMEVGQYLPSWHPYTDYRNEYFSRKDLGGGAIRTLSHEIDLAQYFFGEPKEVNAKVMKVSDLDIDVDDYTLILMDYPENLVKLELDFISKKPKRQGTFHGTQADLIYDFTLGLIQIYNKEGILINEYKVEDNDMYNKQMKAFLEQDNSINSTLEDSIVNMRIIEQAEKKSNL